MKACSIRPVDFSRIPPAGAVRGHPLPFAKRGEARPLNSRDVDEGVRLSNACPEQSRFRLLVHRLIAG